LPGIEPQSIKEARGVHHYTPKCRPELEGKKKSVLTGRERALIREDPRIMVGVKEEKRAGPYELRPKPHRKRYAT